MTKYYQFDIFNKVQRSHHFDLIEHNIMLAVLLHYITALLPMKTPHRKACGPTLETLLSLTLVNQEELLGKLTYPSVFSLSTDRPLVY